MKNLELEARRLRHKANVDAALEAADQGTIINLSALMSGAVQTGATNFGGDDVAELTCSEPLASDHWREEGGQA